MRAYRRHRSVFEINNFIHSLNRRDSVSDKYRRFAFSRLFKVFENNLFGFGIDGGNRIVQNKNGRIFNDRSRYRYPLFLPARNGNAPFAEHRFVPVAELDYIVVNIGYLRGFYYLLVG